MENTGFVGTLIDGKMLASKITENLISQINVLQPKMKLIIVTTGNSVAGMSYVKSKVNKCKELGIESNVIHYDFLNINTLRDLCNKLCSYDYPPFIIQLPITGDVIRTEIYEELYNNMKANQADLSDSQIRKHIAMMDVDGIISPDNILYTYAPSHMLDMNHSDSIDYYNLPCTPMGIMYMIDSYLGEDLSGTSATILGRSELVSKPLYQYLMDRDCTVTMCHSKTDRSDIVEYIKNSDIIISAMGKLNALSDLILSYNKDDLSDLHLENKTLIDVSINRGPDGKLHGDCDSEIAKKFKYYTPVPGGVGPMTVAMLMYNVVKFYMYNAI